VGKEKNFLKETRKKKLYVIVVRRKRETVGLFGGDGGVLINIPRRKTAPSRAGRDPGNLEKYENPVVRNWEGENSCWDRKKKVLV